MAQYNIVSLNYMTAGGSRGLLDMNVSPTYLIGKKISILDRTDENGLEHTSEFARDGVGVITESGRYDTERTDTIDVYSGNSDEYRAGILSNADAVMLLNETQRFTLLSSLSGGYYQDSEISKEGLDANPPLAVRLYTSVDFDIYNQSDLSAYEIYNDSHVNQRKVFEFEVVRAQNTKNVLANKNSGSDVTMPIYDIVDVSIKSFKKKEEINVHVPNNVGRGRSDANVNENIDIYMTVDDTPVGICQYSNDAIILTQDTNAGPYYLNTGLRFGQYDETRYGYSWSLVRKPAHTDLYACSLDFGGRTLKEYLSSHNFTDDPAVDNKFMAAALDIRRRLQDMRYNFLIHLDQNGDTNVHLNTDLDYDDGNIYGDYMTGKNMYNSTYSMEMRELSAISHCREYCGVLNTNKKVPVLKYYDNRTYEKNDEWYDQQNKLDTASTTMTRSKKYPYQKVEYVFKTAADGQCRHKSTLFSIKIRNTGLADEELTESENGRASSRADFYNLIKKDIDNNIRQMVDNICPANTQLFKTIYME